MKFLTALRDPKLFGAAFAPLTTGDTWRVGLAATYGEPLDPSDLRASREITGAPTSVPAEGDDQRCSPQVGSWYKATMDQRPDNLDHLRALQDASIRLGELLQKAGRDLEEPVPREVWRRLAEAGAEIARHADELAGPDGLD